MLLHNVKEEKGLGRKRGQLKLKIIRESHWEAVPLKAAQDSSMACMTGEINPLTDMLILQADSDIKQHEDHETSTIHRFMQEHPNKVLLPVLMLLLPSGICLQIVLLFVSRVQYPEETPLKGNTAASGKQHSCNTFNTFQPIKLNAQAITTPSF